MNLIIVGQVNLLHHLYGRVLIPEAVRRELLAIGAEEPGMEVIQKISWIEKRPVANISLVNALLFDVDKGEAEAIALALEAKADLLILDERRGRKADSRLGLKIIGILGVLVQAKRKGLIVAVKPVLDNLTIKAGFWMGSQLYARVLEEVGE